MLAAAVVVALIGLVLELLEPAELVEAVQGQIMMGPELLVLQTLAAAVVVLET